MIDQFTHHSERDRYDPRRSYRWNYDHPPSWDAASHPGTNHAAEQAKSAEGICSEQRWLPQSGFTFLDIPVASPLGIAAGPLLNGAWCLHYASLGFDVLTYKTVRSVSRECYEMPNLVPVQDETMTGSEQQVAAQIAMDKTWAVSFGMPSSSPDVWRKDIEETRSRLDPCKVLSVSVVGTHQAGWGLDELAEDYALCAKWAMESGADAIEANFSCPNVDTCDGQLYQSARESRMVASAIRRCIGEAPLIIKIGHVPEQSEALELTSSLNGIVNGLSMTNSLAAAVIGQMGEPFFHGQKRGICGEAIREVSVRQVARFHRVKKELGSEIHLIGVGGIHTSDHVKAYLDVGASACQLATSVMTDPQVGMKILSGLNH